MTNDVTSNYKPTAEERDADSRADMWCSLGVVGLAWVAAIYWLSNL